MTYADKGLSLFALMNEMSDELINESDIRCCAAVKPKRERSGRLSAFMNHPAMVAVLCAVVSLGVIVAIVLAGRGGPAVPPVAETPPVNESGTVTEIETAQPNDSEFISADFASYESIIRMYRKIVEVSPDWAEKQTEIDALFSFPDEQARQWYTTISKSVMIFYPRDAMLYCEPDGYRTFGFAVKDVDGDRAYELILMAEDFTMVALFTMRDGKPILLEDFWNRKKGYVNEKGQIMISGSNGADVGSQEIYHIDSATGQLVFEEALGLDGHTDDLEIIYYQRIGEEKSYISEEEFNSLRHQAPYAGFGVEQNERVLKNDYTHLFIEPVFENYDDVLTIFRQYLLCDSTAERDALEMELIAQGMTENDNILLSLLSIDARNFPSSWGPAYTFKDLDRDGQDELILLTADQWVFGLYTMENGVPKDLGYTAGWGMDMGFIAADGTVCQVYLSKGQNETVKLQRLMDGELVTVEEFGTIDEKVWVDFGAESTGHEEIYFYRTVNGERQKITADEYRALQQQYGIDTMTGFSTDAGFTNVTPLFPDDVIYPDGKG